MATIRRFGCQVGLIVDLENHLGTEMKRNFCCCAAAFFVSQLAATALYGQNQHKKEMYVNDFAPCWSPDGSKIVFSSTRTSGSFDNTQKHEATNEWASRSPDGRKIAFRSNRDGHFEVYVINADGSGQRRITTLSPGEDAK
jgi:tricorn protease-like protein